MFMKRYYLLICMAAFSLMGRAQGTTSPESQPSSEKQLRVLAIGNSFSEDAVEQYLYELGHEAGIEMTIGSAVRGGQGLRSNWIEISGNNPAFGYRTIKNGVREEMDGQRVEDIFMGQQWDIVTIQQVSQESGMTSTFEPYLRDLIEYFQQRKPGQKMGYQMTWAYAKTSTHGGFANYGSSQEVMYDSIVHAAQYVQKAHPEVSVIIPSGTAIQNARTTFLGDHMNRDGFHLDLLMGRYTAACTWFEALTGISSVGMKYRPNGVSETAAHACQAAAHAAILKPYEVTDLADEGFAGKNDIKPKALVKLNFGDVPSTNPEWNNITPACRTHTEVLDAEQNPTGIILTCHDDYNGCNVGGASVTDTGMDMPGEVSNSCVWGFCTGAFGGVPQPTFGYTFSHMNPNLKYTFTLFASRIDCTDSRMTSFMLQGKETVAGSLEAANNDCHTLVFSNVQPTPDGIIRLTAMPGIGNTNIFSFYYLNAMTIKCK